MPATVIVNNMTVVHKASNGISQAFPDVCKTPAPPAPPVPIPYPNIAMSSDAADTATTVKADGNPIMLSTSKYATSTGDEAGSLFGVVSNKVKGSANPQMYSMDVKADGKNVFRQLDIMLHNGNSQPTNTPPGPNMNPPAVAMPPKQDPKIKKITEVKWSDEKLKCGDIAVIETKTENYDDGDLVFHTIRKAENPRVVAVVKCEVSGNAADSAWITKAGQWQKDPLKLKAVGHAPGNDKESSNQLTIEVPAEKSGQLNGGGLKMFKLEKTIVKLVPVGPSMFKKVYGIVPTKNFIVKDYKFDIGIKEGVFTILCKIELVNKGVKPAKLEHLKSVWKKRIEGVWDKKWKEHRKKCMRLNCTCSTGCCMFPIRVKCEFVAAGGHRQVNIWPGTAHYDKDPAKSRWWDS